MGDKYIIEKLDKRHKFKKTLTIVCAVLFVVLTRALNSHTYNIYIVTSVKISVLRSTFSTFLCLFINNNKKKVFSFDFNPTNKPTAV